MRLIIIIIILFIGMSRIDGMLNRVNYNLEKIVRLLEAKGETK